MITARRKRRNVNLQLFFAVVLYACCLYRILTEQLVLEKEFQNIVFSFFYNALFYRLLSLFLLAANTILLTFVVRWQGLIELRNYYPSISYLLLSFLFPTVLNPLALFAGLIFIVGIFQNMFDLEENTINRKIFRFGFSVGILALIHFPLVLLLFFAYLACIMYRRFGFRIFLLSIVGILAPFLYWYSALYITGYDFSFQENIRQMGENLLKFQQFRITETPFVLIVTILLLGMGLKLMHKLWVASVKTSVLRRKKYYMLMIVFLFSIALAFLYSQFYLETFLIVYSVILAIRQ